MTISDMTQPRTATGQFAEKEGSAPEIGLAEFGDASFEYPPARYADAEQVIRFWENVPVPSSALDAMRVSYALAQTRYKEAGAENHAAMLYESTPNWQAEQERDPGAWIARVNRAQEDGAAAAAQEWSDRFEPEIARHEARDVARAIQMWYYADLAGTPEEGERVRQHVVDIGGQPMTVAQVRERYAFCQDVGFDDTSFEPYDTRILAELERLREDLRDFRETDEFYEFMEERDARIAQRDTQGRRGR